MRIRHSINLEIADDTDMKDPLFGPFDEVLDLVQIDGYDSQASGKIVVAMEDTKEVPFGDVGTVQGVYLEVNGDCSIAINEGDPIDIICGAGTGVAKFFMEATITKLELTAGDEAALLGTYCVWGTAAVSL